MKPADILKCAELARVFPLKPGTKNGQLLRSWKRESSQDPATIQEWARRWPDANWAFALGRMPDGKFLVALDIDTRPDKNGFASLARLEAEHGKLPDGPAVRTPSGGEHRYFTANRELTNSASRIAPGLDIRATGGYTLCPGSVIDGRRYEIVGRGDNIPPMPDWLVGLAGRHRTAPKPSGEATTAPSAATRAQRYLASLAVSVEGSRNDDAFRAAATIKDYGLGEADCLATMVEHWQAHPPLPLDELTRTVQSAYARPGLGSESPENDFERVPQSEQQRKRRYVFSSETARFSLADLTTAPSPQPFVIDGLLPCAPGALVAPGGSSKSTLLLHQAVHVILGRPWFGREILKPGPVIFMSAEDDRRLIRYRLYHLAAALKLSQDEMRRVVAGLHVEDLTGRGYQLVECDRNGNLIRTQFADELVEEYKAIEPSIVVFDPLTFFGPGERFLNDSESALMAAGHRLCAMGCATLFVHHTGQAVARSHIVDQYTGRGGSALADNGRFQFQLARHEAGDSKEYRPPATIGKSEIEAGNVFRFHANKVSWVPPHRAPIWITRDGFNFRQHVAEPISREQEIDRDLLEKAVRVTRFVAQMGDTRLSVTQVTARRAQIGLSRDNTRAAVYKAIDCGLMAEKPLPAKERTGARQNYLVPAADLDERIAAACGTGSPRGDVFEAAGDTVFDDEKVTA